MPELPEVEHVKRGLAPKITGLKIVETVFSDTVINAHESGRKAVVKGEGLDYFRSSVMNAEIETVDRRSKYLLFRLKKEERTEWILSHLGMTGAWFVVNTVEEIGEIRFRNHVHVIFTLSNEQLLVYSDIRRFGEMRHLKNQSDHPPLLAIGPEPFDADTESRFLTALEWPRFSQKPIKESIMHHSVIAGCGNIYATEALFRARVNPKRKTERLSLQKKKELFHHIVDVLKEGIEAGGSSISDYRNVNGEAGGMQERLQMYAKQACPLCGYGVKKAVIGGRTSHYCPKCQR
ncbi:bifunctional DNA-formamidopyrimidine glycosylase/DNA-(apurinic or apyrimidinic site) lyase [Jeotgalibacillus sp. R-1-5s-1]|uniref:bifunctional DNA-formamidopyrimidine glycosylase/DNA-(apurinic or apyrimidinic site) lyase n=1 Tax=Jeotgalibacillus sp. R-1-5s-1 TaxID=2555897 RepID=UPI00106A2C39|nr:bifunctional DNA-formamidopyrimidine glycosylase/DNA-(apurinic or apyrimidinic site) lyase [Jeotgalibacillus sp. R-1-5s-1]TFD92484.1 bifunctional DNA-formamidopyrimidine glycosylase/DNA-(apurinic or apyrimidinic site) lyase [Jeotgalibacillus sp. R-1-5s-1]